MRPFPTTSQAFADSLLSSRIALQKAVQAANSLPTPSSAPPASVYLSATPEIEAEVEAVWGELVECSEELFQLRAVRFFLRFLPFHRVFPIESPPVLISPSSFEQNLLSTNESLTPPSASDDTPFGSSRKRSRSDMADDVPSSRSAWLSSTLSDLSTLSTLLDPLLRTTVTKWSDKVLAASGLSLKSGGGGADKKFKAVNQNAMQQIDHALSASTGERERLIKRTRVRRTMEGVGSVVLGKVGAADEGEEGDVRMKQPLEGEGQRVRVRDREQKEVEEECFDDSDWYGQVLRDLVESRMLDLGASPSPPFFLLPSLFPSSTQLTPSSPLRRRRHPDLSPPRFCPRPRQEGEEGRRHSGE